MQKNKADGIIRKFEEFYVKAFMAGLRACGSLDHDFTKLDETFTIRHRAL
jgi:hypothetical protein